jgi:hypothetical protein
MNREMLKEAIAEAKTIKETAIANAKAALEEAFTPQLTAMFAERLNEEDEMEQEGMYETTDKEDEGLGESFNLDEILAELEMTDEADDMVSEDDTDKMDEDLMLEEMSDEEIEELVMKVIDDMIETGKLMPGEGEEEESEEDLEDVEDLDGEEVEVEDEVELDELLNELMGEEKEEQVGESVEGISNMITRAMESPDAGKAAMILAAAGITTAAAKAIWKFFKERKAEKSMDEMADTTEMEETISELRNELNEVNLLNAKLLYTNKIFKAKNLTESEKVKVLNTFDRAETVKEVKLVFETLAESFKAVAKKAPIKESLGSASRSIAPSQAKQPIIEVNDAFARMQRLAGLRK